MPLGAPVGGGRPRRGPSAQRGTTALCYGDDLAAARPPRDDLVVPARGVTRVARPGRSGTPAAAGAAGPPRPGREGRPVVVRPGAATAAPTPPVTSGAQTAAATRTASTLRMFPSGSANHTDRIGPSVSTPSDQEPDGSSNVWNSMPPARRAATSSSKASSATWNVTAVAWLVPA